ncbi:MAG: hypothetical protein SO072_07755 [Dysosmobacter sp.]|nr:hypothetical protein [Dysosmobacter sp.]
MALNEIGYSGKVYADQDVESAVAYCKSTIVDDELTYDTFEAEVWDYAYALLMLADSGPSVNMMNASGRFMLARQSRNDLTDFTYGAPVTWTHKGKIVLRQFLESVKRTGKYKYLLSCVSGVGLIAQSRHYGGLYSNVSFSTVLSDIIGGVFPYTVDADVASIAIFGWLPVDNRRANLRKLLTATGVVIKTNADGIIRFAAPSTFAPSAIPDAAIQIGGSVDRPTPYQAVKITEHAFAKTPNDILTTLLDGEAVGDNIITPKGAHVFGSIITFSDPMHDLSITGSTILESGVNYAVLAPSMACTLTGYKYSHTTRVVTAGSLTASERATKRLDNCTLVNVFNADAVAQRWLEYFSGQKEISVNAVWNGEHPADAVAFSDPFDDAATGLIESQDVRMSAKVTADITVQAGRIPAITGNGFSHVMIVETSGTITLPAEVSGKIRLVLISGGKGGSSGYAGNQVKYPSAENTSTGNHYKTKTQLPGPPAEGGDPGDPGIGGRVFQITINASAGQKLAVVIGKGGKGGAFSAGENTAGEDGTDTTVGEYSTASGQVVPGGFLDPINNVLYGGTGKAGIKGGRGGGYLDDQEVQPGSLTVDGITYSGGSSIGLSSNVTYESGGSASQYGKKKATAWGGYGGGPAYGANGSDGEAGRATAGGNFAVATGGKGGDGGNALPPAKAQTRGSGGAGGNGGGAPGSSGKAQVDNEFNTSSAPDFQANTNPGTPGNGSDGGEAADGVLLIYY